jgi:hypothetical protein
VNAGMATGFAAVVNAVATAASTPLLARIGFLQVSQALLTGFAPPLSLVATTRVKRYQALGRLRNRRGLLFWFYSK